jgi:hypothetical protein
MNLSKYNLLLGLLIVMFAVGGVGGHFGYSVNGVPQGGVIGGSSPGILGVVDWIWSSIGFLFSMVTFRVDNMPSFVSAIFVIMSIMVVVLIVSLIRGTD